MSSQYISYDVTHSTHVDDDGTTYYHTTLKMPSVEYYYVGYYYCINNKSLTIEDVDYSAEVDAYRASSIYLYVNGEYLTNMLKSSLSLHISHFRSKPFTGGTTRSDNRGKSIH